MKLLGSGTSGAVWSAKNELIDRDVALKILSPEVAQDAVALKRFFNEAKASGRVRSSSIVEILDLGQAEDGSPFLVFELLRGEPFDVLLKRETTIDPERLVDLMLGVAKALDAAHAQGIIHRDLKPANLYAHRNPNGDLVAKILDFGISKFFDVDLTLTRTGTVVGSPAYMSPEQASGQDDIDGRTDLWSVGVVMYEALTGALPHQAANYNALMVRILTKDVEPVQKRRADIPESVCTIVNGLLRRDRNERIGTAGELAKQLEVTLRNLRRERFQKQDGRRSSDRSGRPSSMPPPPGMVRRRRVSRSLIVALAAALGVAVGIALILLMQIVGK